MGSLSNLYVSQSYQSLLHLGTDTSIDNFANPPGYNSVEDGLGNALGFAISASGDVLFSHSVQIDENLSVDGNFDIDGNITISGTFDIEGKVTVNDNVRINGNLEVSGTTNLTGSLVVSNNITASNAFITSDLNVGGTLFANKVVTLIESASVIFSSGSNILGDETSDTQTLIGSIIMSGSSSLTGSMGITGNLVVGGNGNFGGSGSFIGDLTATGNISSSTLSGVGNVTIYSASVNNRLTFLEGPFSTSVDLRLDQLEAFSSSLQADFATQVELTQTASFLQNQINQKLNTSSFNAYTQSTDARLNSLQSFTGSYATTGSNTFIGSEIFSGSVRGLTIPITITSSTASIDCSLGNFFTLALPNSSTIRLTATNVQPGQTLSLRITQPSSGIFSSVTYSSVIKFPISSPYIASATIGATDILSFQSYDTTTLFGVSVNNMV
jgi:predicted acyltransferase (DUF342 family)